MLFQAARRLLHVHLVRVLRNVKLVGVGHHLRLIAGQEPFGRQRAIFSDREEATEPALALNLHLSIPIGRRYGVRVTHPLLSWHGLRRPLDVSAMRLSAEQRHHLSTVREAAIDR